MAIKILQIHLWTEKDPVDKDLRLYMQVLEQSGLPTRKTDGKVRITGCPEIDTWRCPDDDNDRRLFLRGERRLAEISNRLLRLRGCKPQTHQAH